MKLIDKIRIKTVELKHAILAKSTLEIRASQLDLQHLIEKRDFHLKMVELKKTDPASFKELGSEEKQEALRRKLMENIYTEMHDNSQETSATNSRIEILRAELKLLYTELSGQQINPVYKTLGIAHG